MDNQISAMCFTEYEQGYGYMVTEYLAKCGCNWKVDQWGNVRAVRVCRRCTHEHYPWEDQLSLLSPADG